MSNRHSPSGVGPGAGAKKGTGQAPRTSRTQKPPRHTGFQQRGNSAATHSPLARALMASNTTRSILSKRVSIRHGKRPGQKEVGIVDSSDTAGSQGHGGNNSGSSSEEKEDFFGAGIRPRGSEGSGTNHGTGANAGSSTSTSAMTSGHDRGTASSSSTSASHTTTPTTTKLTAASLRDRVPSKSMSALDISKLSSSSPAGMVGKPKSPKGDSVLRLPSMGGVAGAGSSGLGNKKKSRNKKKGASASASDTAGQDRSSMLFPTYGESSSATDGSTEETATSGARHRRTNLSSSASGGEYSSNDDDDDDDGLDDDDDASSVDDEDGEDVSDDDTPVRPQRTAQRTAAGEKPVRLHHRRSKSFGSTSALFGGGTPGQSAVPDLYNNSSTSNGHTSNNGVHGQPGSTKVQGHSAVEGGDDTLVHSSSGAQGGKFVDERDRDDVPYIRGSRVAEISGFVLWITSFSCGVMFFLWAYLPQHYLHQLGIMWYPRQYWALAAPAWILVLIAYVAFMYIALNMMSSAPTDSYNLVSDNLAAAPPADEGLAPSRHAVPPLYDIPAGLISRLMYATAPSTHTTPSMSTVSPPTPTVTSTLVSPLLAGAGDGLDSGSAAPVDVPSSGVEMPIVGGL
eukprot:TRINITY_DN2243_c0_g2_i2.p1 TRINITY_DN2243_c0_g2~~TRINITY_DN2243_c0_g2_i2.p1  ORF type:complete len:624 (+),score=146.15 TRINITY_DN2243_c0_g2_i2:143-2014(+)